MQRKTAPPETCYWIDKALNRYESIAPWALPRETLQNAATFSSRLFKTSHDTLQNGVSHRCACVKLSAKGGVSHHSGGALTSLKEYRAIWGNAAIVSRYRAIWGPLSLLQTYSCYGCNETS